MKILHISAFALRGGCEKNCYHFINGSKNFKHELIVLDQEGPMSSDWALLGLQVRHLNILKFGLYKFKEQLSLALKGLNYDLAICWSTIRLPIQLNVLGQSATKINVYLGNPLNHNTWKDYMLGFLYPCKGKVKLMACSNYVENTYRSARYYNRFIVKTSLNPVALPNQFPLKSVNPEKFKIGMVARLDPIKDHATLIEAFFLVNMIIDKAELHLVGDGMLRSTLEKYVESRKLTSKVFFYGDVKNVYEHLNRWDVFVYSTTPSEGLGSVVEEAMANGLTCILSDLPMLRELAPKSGLALFFEAGNAKELSLKIKSLYENKEAAVKIGKAAYEYANLHFGVDRFIENYITD